MEMNNCIAHYIKISILLQEICYFEAQIFLLLQLFTRDKFLHCPSAHIAN